MNAYYQTLKKCELPLFYMNNIQNVFNQNKQVLHMLFGGSVIWHEYAVSIEPRHSRHKYELCLVPLEEQDVWAWVFKKDYAPCMFLHVLRPEKNIEHATKLALNWFLQHVWWNEHTLSA